MATTSMVQEVGSLRGYGQCRSCKIVLLSIHLSDIFAIGCVV